MLRSNSAAAAALLLLAVAPSAAEFEEAATPALSELLPGVLRQSVHHSVEEVHVDGRFYSFQLDSEFGTYVAPSLALLRIRVREIETLSQAVNQLESREDQGIDAMRGQYSISADSALDILTHPVSSAGDIAGQVAGNLNETLTGVPAAGADRGAEGGRMEPVRDPVQDMHRRNAAAQWGLDPYSSNLRVQAFLDDVARARSAGRISAGAPTFFANSQQRLSIEDPEIDTEVAASLKSDDPAVIRSECKELLVGMQIRAELAGAFVRLPAYSPRHLARISRYLRALDGVLNRAAFIEAALDVQDERTVLAFEEAAMMLAHYHRHQGRLQKLHAGRDLLAAVTADNRVVYFAPVDVVYWSRATAELFDEQVTRDRAAGLRGWELVAAGAVTPIAAGELARRDYTVRDRFVH